MRSTSVGRARECIKAVDLCDRVVRHYMLILGFEPAIEPTGKGAHCFDDSLFGVSGNILITGCIPLDRNPHGVFVIVVPGLTDIGNELIEVRLLSGLQLISDLV